MKKWTLLLIMIAINTLLLGCVGRNEAIAVADELRATNLAAKEEVNAFFEHQQKLTKAQAELMLKNAQALNSINAKSQASPRFSCLNLIYQADAKMSAAYRLAVTKGVTDYQAAKGLAISAFEGLNTPLTSRLKQAQNEFKADPSDANKKMQFYSLYVQVRENEQTFNSEFSDKADKKLSEFLAAITQQYQQSSDKLANLAVQQCGKLPKSDIPDLSAIENQLVQTATLLTDSTALDIGNQQLQGLLDENAKAGDQIKNYFAFYSTDTIKNFVFSLPKDFLNILLNREPSPSAEETKQAAKALEDSTLGLVKSEIKEEYKSLESTFKSKASTLVANIKEYGESLKAILGK